MRYFVLFLCVIGINQTGCSKKIYVDQLDGNDKRIDQMDIPLWRPEIKVYRSKGYYYPATEVIYNNKMVRWIDSSDDSPMGMPTNELYKIKTKNRFVGTTIGFFLGYFTGRLFYNSGLLGKTNKPFGMEQNVSIQFRYGLIGAVGGFIIGFPVTYQALHESKVKAKIQPVDVRAIKIKDDNGY